MWVALFFTDSLDFVTQWLEEAAEDLTNQKYKSALPAGGGAAGSGDGPTPSPVAVQNYAYLKLLRWDHLRRPFPEVGAAERSNCLFLFVRQKFEKISFAVIQFSYQRMSPFKLNNSGGFSSIYS